MDLLSGVFAAVRFSGGGFLDAEFTAPWCAVSQVGPDELRAQGRVKSPTAASEQSNYQNLSFAD
jgi:hypothetical protein